MGKQMSNSITLQSPRDFFDHVTKPNFDDFFSQPSSFKNAFGLAMSLFNINEWVYEFNQPSVEQKYGKTFAKPWALWNEVERIVPEAAYIRDLSNASKHVRLHLHRHPSTDMSHIANTEIQIVGYGAGSFGAGRYDGQSVVFQDNGQQIYFDDCAREVFNFWKALIDELYPVQIATIQISPAAPQSANS